MDRGKQFEDRFRRDWTDSIPNSFILRLYDNTSGYLSISNISDFIGYAYPNIYILECKEHKGASIPFTNLTQFDKMKRWIGTKGLRCGFVIWLSEKDKVLYVPCATIQQMKEDGEKSIGIRHLESDYRIIEIPSQKLRTFMKSDYSVMLELEEGD